SRSQQGNAVIERALRSRGRKGYQGRSPWLVSGPRTKGGKISLFEVQCFVQVASGMCEIDSRHYEITCRGGWTARMSIFAAVSPNGWAHALGAHKCAHKVALACEAANRRDFREREFCSAQQILGAVDAMVKNPLVRFHARRLMEGPGK